MIEFNQVYKRYAGNAIALSNITLSIDKGEFIFLAGPSGAGKSTLLKMIAGIERPTSGTVTVNGQDIGRMNASGLPYLRRKLGLILQGQPLLPNYSVLWNVMLPLMVASTVKDEAEKRSRAALDKVGLLDKALCAPMTLSGGEQQRAAVARAIVHRPQIILADEATANLDRKNAIKVLDALRAFHSVGVTCLISTHDEQFLKEADRIIHLDGGKQVMPLASSMQEISA